MSTRSPMAGVLAVSLLSLFLLASCTTPSPTSCDLSRSHSLARAFDAVRANLEAGCTAHFDDYLDHLLAAAENDPGPENKRAFSDFLMWTADEGILSRRQAQEHYNRYFNVKFVALMGDYNNCAHTCPSKDRVLSAMELELSEKERGLLRVSRDTESYSRADRLFQETELVLEATCTACTSAVR